MVAGKTCTACRNRKVRCDGREPVCTPCSKARQQLECSYVATSSSVQAVKGPLLQKGAACYPCRKKKKKCDAIRPFCTTCKIAGKELDCQYEDNVERSLTEALIARAQELERRLAVYEGQTQDSSVLQSRLVVGSSPPEEPDIMRFFSPSFSIPIIQATQLNDIPNFFLDSCPRSPAPRDPSPLTDSLYISPPTDLRNCHDFRALFLSHLDQLGVCLTQVKLEAIMIGDLNNAAAHPSLIHVALLMGYRLWQERMKTSYSPQTEENQLHLVRQALLTDPDPVTRLQVECILAIYFLIRRLMTEGREQLQAAAHTALEKNLTFNIPTEGPMLDLPSTSKEQIAALSQLIYLDKAANIVLDEPSLLTVQYEHEFRTVPYLFPSLSKSNLVVLRARSISLLQRTRALSKQWSELLLIIGNPPYPSSGPQDQWYEEYWSLMGEISEHLGNVTPTMLKATFFRHRANGLALKLCMIISLTAAAEMHRLMAAQHTESRLKCLDTVFEIVGITRSLKDDDYIFLDPILGICWMMVATVLNQERSISIDQFSVVHYKELFQVIVNSASKLGHALPFMENSLQTINGVASLVD